MSHNRYPGGKGNGPENIWANLNGKHLKFQVRHRSLQTHFPSKRRRCSKNTWDFIEIIM